MDASSVQSPPSRAGAGGVGGRGHVGAAEFGQPGDELLSGLAGGDVAAVQQQVAVIAERGADALQGAGLRLQCRAVDDAVTEQQLPGLAVRDDVDRVHATAPVQGLGDLRQAVARRVEQQDFRRAGGRADELLPVRDPGVDDDQDAHAGGSRRLTASRRKTPVSCYRPVGSRPEQECRPAAAAPANQRSRRRETRNSCVPRRVLLR
ncbi:MAG: hypothetical protein QM722_23115 [Piscinibacter sp.]